MSSKIKEAPSQKMLFGFREGGIAAPPRRAVRVLALAGAALVFFCIALGPRVYRLGQNDFWNDELLHVSAASSLAEEGNLTLPSGRPYRRAMPYTAAVSVFLKAAGVSETTARVPSVFFSLLGLALFGAVVSRVFGKASAIAFVLFMALSPLDIKWARECRMYTFFTLCYGLLALSFYRLLEPGAGSRARKLFFGVLTAALFLLSFRVHALTQFYVPTALVYALLMFGWKFRDSGTAAMTSRYAVLVFAPVAAAVLIMTFYARFFDAAVRAMIFVPAWAESHSRPFYYTSMLQDQYPALFLAYPVCVLYALKRFGRRALYVVCLFIVPFLLHTFLFRWKEQRYLLYVLPYFLFPGAIAAGEVARRAAASLGRKDFPRALAWTALAAFLWIHPAYSQAVRTATQINHPPWKAVAYAFASEVAGNDTVVASDASALSYYGMPGRLFKMNNRHLHETFERGGMRLDDYSGAPILGDAKALREAAAGSPHVWFLMRDYDFLDPRAIPDGVRTQLVEKGEWFNRDGTPRKAPSPDAPRDKKDPIFICRLTAPF